MERQKNLDAEKDADADAGTMAWGSGSKAFSLSPTMTREERVATVGEAGGAARRRVPSAAALSPLARPLAVCGSGSIAELRLGEQEIKYLPSTASISRWT